MRRNMAGTAKEGKPKHSQLQLQQFSFWRRNVAAVWLSPEHHGNL